MKRGNLMFCDYHVHSIFSDDSNYEMEKIIQDAIALKMQEICFTDHVDYGIKKDWDDPTCNEKKILNVDYPRYFQEIERLQEKYQDKIIIKKGLEFGIQSTTIQDFQKLYNRYPMDFVILSVHQVNNQEFWTYEFQKGHSEYEYYQAYYQEMYDLVKNYHDYSVIGHMDMLKRYDDHDGYPAFEQHKDIITKILQTVIADHKGIELNTSSRRYGLDDLMPSTDILKLYYDLGGRILTIGSDSHKKEDLGAHIEALKKELKAIGFESFCTFKKMKPIFHPL